MPTVAGSVRRKPLVVVVRSWRSNGVISWLRSGNGWASPRRGCLFPVISHVLLIGTMADMQVADVRKLIDGLRWHRRRHSYSGRTGLARHRAQGIRRSHAVGPPGYRRHRLDRRSKAVSGEGTVGSAGADSGAAGHGLEGLTSFCRGTQVKGQRPLADARGSVTLREFQETCY